jgi:hypothetical protein
MLLNQAITHHTGGAPTAPPTHHTTPGAIPSPTPRLGGYLLVLPFC